MAQRCRRIRLLRAVLVVVSVCGVFFAVSGVFVVVVWPRRRRLELSVAVAVVRALAVAGCLRVPLLAL
eukprot:7876059-Pyramimonas_sp.AAC.1